MASLTAGHPTAAPQELRLASPIRRTSSTNSEGKVEHTAPWIGALETDRSPTVVRGSCDAPINAESDDYRKTLELIKSKLQALSYGVHGQDPKRLFHHYDRDNSGTIDLLEFTNAMRKGGHLP